QTLESWRTKHNEQVCLVTFNYDTLLDDACRSVLPRFQLLTPDANTSDERFRLFKLHGSTDWYQELRILDRTAPLGGVDQGTLELWLIENAPVLEPTGRYVRAGQSVDGLGLKGVAVSIPTVTKTGES